MTYNYKGTNLTNILQSGTAITGYAGLTGTAMPAGETSSLPYNFGYSINGQSLSNAYIAKYTDYTASIVATVPAGATHMRILAIGGGGSGGSGGGGAYARNDTSAKSCSATGGQGSPGGCGSYITSSDIAISNTTVQLQIGAGGVAGVGGQYTDRQNNNNSTNAQGNSGTSFPGNPTVVVYNGITYTANGGLAGGNGEGGDANEKSGGDSNTNPGTNQAPTNLIQIATAPTTWAQLSQYGRGGIAGTAGASYSNKGNPGGAGSNGATRIIWLYQ